MPSHILFLLFVALIPFGAICLPARYRNGGIEGRAEQVSLGSGWYDPRANGGRMLDFTTRHLGEPLNVIISGHSDPFILTETGFHYYAKSIGFAEECLGLHYGKIHHADLGDGNYRMEEQFLARQHYFPVWGTCWESVAGGNHFRAWKQEGPLANSGAWFLGVSKEEDSSKNHIIVDDGYNLGRNWLVEKAIAGSHLNGMWWRAEVVWNENDLLRPGRHGKFNSSIFGVSMTQNGLPPFGLSPSGAMYLWRFHPPTGINHGIAQDGRVAILTIIRV